MASSEPGVARLAGQPSVLLVSMPWTNLTEPSPALGLLAGVLEREGIRTRCLHLNLFMLQYLRAETYNELASIYSLNDFLFSRVLDPELTHSQLRRLRQKVGETLNRGVIDPRRFGGVQGFVDALLALRNEVIPSWLDSWATEIAEHPSSLVGFTCMFDQTIASLALASLVKAKAPWKTVALGGYAVQAPAAQMIIGSSEWIDAVCLGEGERTVVGLAQAAAGRIELSSVPGIAFRSPAGEVLTTPAPPAVEMDANPVPVYDGYFADLRRLAGEDSVDVTVTDLPVENSRGCWWGAKHHCVFCGIRDEDLSYRSRNADTVLRTMEELNKRYGIDYFHFTDYILPNQYFATLLPELVRLGSPYRLSAEMKANITEERFALLAKAGFEEVQPGIESFSTSVLRKMRKGVTASQVVYLLVLGRKYNVRIYYNLLYGFPDDESAEYEKMAAQLPRLTHLDAPLTSAPVLITRWAPLQVEPAAFGIGKAEPDESYELIFSDSYLRKSGFRIADFCYYFERPFLNSVRLQRLYQRLDDVVDGWQSAAAAGSAWLHADGDGTRIHDGRGKAEVVHCLTEQEAEVLRACGKPIAVAKIPFSGSPGIDAVIGRLDDLALIFRDGDRVLSLVTPTPAQAS